MRVFGIAGLMVCLSFPAVADQSVSDCKAQADMVMGAVTLRAEGGSKDDALLTLTDALGADAAGMLADWIWSLPQEHLTDEVGTAWEAQCKTL